MIRTSNSFSPCSSGPIFQILTSLGSPGIHAVSFVGSVSALSLITTQMVGSPGAQSDTSAMINVGLCIKVYKAEGKK